MPPTAEDIADADRQFWNLATAIRSAEARGDGPEAASLYEDADYLRRTGITAGIRERCGALVDDWHKRRDETAPTQPPLGGREPA